MRDLAGHPRLHLGPTESGEFHISGRFRTSFISRQKRNFVYARSTQKNQSSVSYRTWEERRQLSEGWAMEEQQRLFLQPSAFGRRCARW
jgi:hypothetical protein